MNESQDNLSRPPKKRHSQEQDERNCERLSPYESADHQRAKYDRERREARRASNRASAARSRRHKRIIAVLETMLATERQEKHLLQIQLKQCQEENNQLRTMLARERQEALDRNQELQHLVLNSTGQTCSQHGRQRQEHESRTAAARPLPNLVRPARPTVPSDSTLHPVEQQRQETSGPSLFERQQDGSPSRMPLWNSLIGSRSTMPTHGEDTMGHIQSQQSHGLTWPYMQEQQSPQHQQEGRSSSYQSLDKLRSPIMMPHQSRGQLLNSVPQVSSPLVHSNQDRSLASSLIGLRSFTNERQSLPERAQQKDIQESGTGRMVHYESPSIQNSSEEYSNQDHQQARRHSPFQESDVSAFAPAAARRPMNNVGQNRASSLNSMPPEVRVQYIQWQLDEILKRRADQT